MTNQNTTSPNWDNLGVTKIDEVESGSFTQTLKDIFVKNPTKFYTQKDFVEHLNKSNPFVNKTLRTLLEKKVISRKRVGSKYFYKLS
jgi:hypothetical protein